MNREFDNIPRWKHYFRGVFLVFILIMALLTLMWIRGRTYVFDRVIIDNRLLIAAYAPHTDRDSGLPYHTIILKNCQRSGLLCTSQEITRYPAAEWGQYKPEGVHFETVAGQLQVVWGTQRFDVTQR